MDSLSSKVAVEHSCLLSHVIRGQVGQSGRRVRWNSSQCFHREFQGAVLAVHSEHVTRFTAKCIHFGSASACAKVKEYYHSPQMFYLEKVEQTHAATFCFHKTHPCILIILGLAHTLLDYRWIPGSRLHVAGNWLGHEARRDLMRTSSQFSWQHVTEVLHPNCNTPRLEIAAQALSLIKRCRSSFLAPSPQTAPVKLYLITQACHFPCKISSAPSQSMLNSSKE